LITISIGKPISPANRTPEQLSAAVEAWIEGEMRTISPGDYGTVPAITAERGASS